MSAINPNWVETFEEKLAEVFNAAERIKLERSAGGYQEFCSSPEVRDLWEFANSSVGGVQITFKGFKPE